MLTFKDRPQRRNGTCCMERIFHPPIENDATKIYRTLMDQPESKAALFICETPEYFKTLSPGYWIVAAKEHLGLFKTILKNPTLAAWVSNVSEKNSKGLLLIAKFSHLHLLAAIEAGNKIYSPEDIASFERSINVPCFRTSSGE